MKFSENDLNENWKELQLAVNERAVVDLAEKLTLDSVKSLTDYLLNHIIDNEQIMKGVILKALNVRQGKNIEELNKLITETERIIYDMKVSLETMLDLMSEIPKKSAPPLKNKADEIEQKMREEQENENENENETETETETPEEPEENTEEGKEE